MTSAGDPPDKADEPFDPYRFGKPDVPPPPEYAPPGYVPDPPAPTPSAPTSAGGWPPSAPQSPPPGQWPPPSGQWPPPGQYPPPSGHWPPPPGQYPPYAAHPPYGTPYSPGTQAGNGRATTGMVLGIISILLCWLIVFDLLLIIPALIYSRQGLAVARRNGHGRGQAIAGVVCACVAVVLVIGGTILARHAASECSGINRGSSSYTRCIENHL